ncbi:MAG: ThuA domain-containing protein [Verrucomicrobiae bacterium]|nr:ThuA domain-containing protein [Verrucomicrobiae bacterium]
MDKLNYPRLLVGLLCLLALTGWSCSKTGDTHSSYAGKKAFFLIGEHEYGTPVSLPAFAKAELEPLGIECQFVFAKSDDRKSPDCHNFDGIEALNSADILILSTRRRFPTERDMATIRHFIESGKPVIGIRTASHAFGEREKGDGYQAPAGHAAWNTFDVDVLGVSYQGHYPEKEGQGPLAVQAFIAENAGEHPIVKNLDFSLPFMIGNKLYEYIDPDPAIKVLVQARYKEGEPVFPVAWTNEKNGKRVFYMSPGSPEEMALPQVQSLLKAAVLWGLNG